MSPNRSADAAGRRRGGARGLGAAGLVVLAAALPGCCFRLGRADGPPSLAFAARSFTEHTEDDAARTAERLSNLWPNLVEDFEDTPRRLCSTSDLYFGH